MSNIETKPLYVFHTEITLDRSCHIQEQEGLYSGITNRYIKQLNIVFKRIGIDFQDSI